jgi:protein subunit release factor B
MDTPKKQLLFSITAKDCEWDYVRGSGKGGQKKNKTSSAVRCRHIPSGAIGYAEDTRSQTQNKKLAFVRMAESFEFKKWHRVEVAKHTGELVEIERKIDKELSNPDLTITESHDDYGKWVQGLTDAHKEF